MQIKGIGIVLALGVPLTAFAATVEKPVYGKFDGVPLESSPIISRMVFGTLPDGSQAPAKVDENTIRVYLANMLGTGLYGVEDVDCRKGTKLTVGVGEWGKIEPSRAAEKPFKLRKMHPKAVETYREACRAGGIAPGW